MPIDPDANENIHTNQHYGPNIIAVNMILKMAVAAILNLDTG